jgi:hypothetical protein
MVLDQLLALVTLGVVFGFNDTHRRGIAYLMVIAWRLTGTAVWRGVR